MTRKILCCLLAAWVFPTVAPAHNAEQAQEIRDLHKAVYDLRREVEALKKILSLQAGTPLPAPATAPPAAPEIPKPLKAQPAPKIPVAGKVVRMPNPEAARSEVDLPEFFHALNRLTAQYRNTRDPQEKLQRLQELSADAGDALRDKHIALTFSIRDARTKGGGIAEIWVEAPEETSLADVEEHYISVTPFKWVRVKMSEAQVLNLRTGETLQLSGKALFFPQRKGDIGLSTNTQQVFTIHILNSANAIGTVTLQDYKATIGLLTFPAP